LAHVTWDEQADAANSLGTDPPLVLVARDFDSGSRIASAHGIPRRSLIVQRIRRVLVGWLAACLTALPLGLFAIVMLAGPPSDAADLVFLLLFGLALTLAISSPALVVAIVAERMGGPQAGRYVFAGAAVVGAAALAAFWFMPTEHAHKFSSETIPLEHRIAFAMTLFAIAAPIGALAGYVYWWIAVRARASS
jgi:hypothetical protein